MKKKGLLILSLLTMILFTTGCTASYTLKYENDTFTEYVNISGQEENEDSPQFDDAHPTYDDIIENGLLADIHGEEYFDISPDSSSFDVNLTHKLKNVKLDELKAVSECFALSSYREGEGIYSMALYGKFTCSFLEDSTFTLETDAEVLKENAHERDGNKYIWHLDQNELGEDGITFQIMKTSVEDANIKNDTMLPMGFKIFVAILIIVVGCALIFLLKKALER
ncbi:MAG: hypothetical protein IJN90_02215 [Bacilli bacterium]|nr:hypothetical protein [Bacilli bacterium]